MAELRAPAGSVLVATAASRSWAGWARRVLGVVAFGGVLACAGVVLVAWDEWAAAPSRIGGLLQVVGLGLVTAGSLALGARGWRVAAAAVAVVLLAYGWLGTWAFGFLWVPGAAALLAALLPGLAVSAAGAPAG